LIRVEAKGSGETIVGKVEGPLGGAFFILQRGVHIHSL